jgi:hypothetical protein
MRISDPHHLISPICVNNGGKSQICKVVGGAQTAAAAQRLRQNIAACEGLFSRYSSLLVLSELKWQCKVSTVL